MTTEVRRRAARIQDLASESCPIGDALWIAPTLHGESPWEAGVHQFKVLGDSPEHVMELVEIELIRRLRREAVDLPKRIQRALERASRDREVEQP